MIVVRWPAACLLAIAAGTASAGESPALCRGHSAALQRQFAALEQVQKAEVRQALRRIEGTDRQLLALRSYVRSRAALPARWSWSQAEIEAYRNSAEYRDLLNEIGKIRAHFEAANPGYQLYANTDVRSLDQQLERWNENTGVTAVASELHRDVCGELATDPATARNQHALRDFLSGWQPSFPPPLAAPGLSLHGRARAIDFQVHRGSRVVAGPEVARIAEDWVAQGWGARLALSVAAVSTRFQGPLTQPNEPWHFEYRP